jgi:predicted DNA-binding protein (MmcQ/YjbR family)
MGKATSRAALTGNRARTRTTGAVLNRLREMCLAFPETTEVSSWGHPNFRAGRKMFATFETFGGRPSIAFRLEPADVDLLLRRKEFFATPYGRGQWVSLRADGRVDWRLVERLLERSYRVVALKRMLMALDRPATE